MIFNITCCTTSGLPLAEKLFRRDVFHALGVDGKADAALRDVVLGVVCVLWILRSRLAFLCHLMRPNEHVPVPGKLTAAKHCSFNLTI